MLLVTTNIHFGSANCVFGDNKIHQRLLKPTHDWLMKILGSIPSDVYS
uniref:Uncharacterized protein n=1 Tax=Arundo donax TaxID=35708 RepID=A0A0A8YSA0_ARUDO